MVTLHIVTIEYANVIAQCQAFSKIKLVYIEFPFAMAYIAKVNSVKVVVSSYMHSHCAITKIFAAVKKDSHHKSLIRKYKIGLLIYLIF